jgi:DNA-binding MarR family transcriptional regulator
MSVETDTLSRQVLEIIPLVMRTVAAEMRRTGHTMAPSHFRLLAMLARCPCNLSQLAERQAVSLPTMSNSITTLVERGWVKRTQVAYDRRVVLIELTPEGRMVLADMQHQVEARVAELLAPLSEAERDTLLVGLAVLRHTFAPAVQLEPASPLGEPLQEKIA